MESPDSVQGRVPEHIRSALPAIIADAEAAVRPAKAKQVVDEITGVLALLGGGMGQEDRMAFQIGASARFMELPGDLVLSALRASPESCDHTRQVVKFVSEYSRRTAQRRHERLAALRRLAEMAALPAITQ